MDAFVTVFNQEKRVLKGFTHIIGALGGCILYWYARYVADEDCKSPQILNSMEWLLYLGIVNLINQVTMAILYYGFSRFISNQTFNVIFIMGIATILVAAMALGMNVGYNLVIDNGDTSDCQFLIKLGWFFAIFAFLLLIGVPIMIWTVARMLKKIGSRKNY